MEPNPANRLRPPPIALSRNPFFQSLRIRLLGPIVTCALLSAFAVALGSYWLGNRWATDELQSRFQSVDRTLKSAHFPLTGPVLRSLAELTRTELIALGPQQQVLQSTIELSDADRQQLRRRPAPAEFTMAERNYRLYRTELVGQRGQGERADQMIVLFDDQLLQASRRRAALLPLVTGLSTIFALGSVTLWMTSRLVRRIGNLHQRVESVAAGDFQSTVTDNIGDELGQLGGAVDSMARQLDQLWQTVNRQQGEKLLHQIAGGMAHQLRNSLTGARMAIELHAAQCPHADDEGVRVAIAQIEHSENHVRRLLLVGSGQQDQPRPENVLVCWNDVRSSLSPIARHLNVQIDWNADARLADDEISDGPSWIAAVTNLIQNAMQAGDQVSVAADRMPDAMMRVTVTDNGPGVPDAIAAELFDPFVTSKPEGLGLGLPVVQRAAETLGGRVQWHRANERTVFEFDAKVIERDAT
ncbi:HAMP domain-containing histidine kinase [Stieleria sp. TO1_6]|nr:HAMP domain-containing histidine kinase [Stieleria tagensis]